MSCTSSSNAFHLLAIRCVCLDGNLQPIAIGLVHGSCDLDGHLRGRCRCFTPEVNIYSTRSIIDDSPMLVPCAVLVDICMRFP